MTNEKTTPYGLTDAQITAIRCAHADLAGVYQCAIRDGNGGADNGHDWKAHRETIEELEQAFPDLLEPVQLDDEADVPADNCMSSDNWDSQYDPDYNEDGTLREIRRGDPDWVELMEKHRIWTMVDCDGSLYITPGVHFVNRMSYHTTRLPWTETTPDVAWDVRGEEDEEDQDE